MVGGRYNEFSLQRGPTMRFSLNGASLICLFEGEGLFCFCFFILIRREEELRKNKLSAVLLRKIQKSRSTVLIYAAGIE